VVDALASQSVLFVGSAPLVLNIVDKLRKRPDLGIRPIGYLAEQPLDTALPLLGAPADVWNVVKTKKPYRVVIAMNERRGCLPLEDMLDIRFSGVLVEEVASLYEEVFGRVCVDEIRPSHLILSSGLGPRPWKVRLQTVYSIAIACLSVLITAPITLLAALLIKLTSRGPILYRQARMGLNGERFFIYKFRSMRQNAEAATGPVWATANDSRVTRVGRVLRKTRIDELPQLFNVLRGDMSIVGPRPERPEFVRKFSQTIPFYRQRHCVKPGITGWAQISYKYAETEEDTKIKLEYDLYYIKNLSPSLDAYIMFHTLKTMLLSRGV
jgi:exopolysaccharide biosynthesis polyprenyl glycosylphosphotransferase